LLDFAGLDFERHDIRRADFDALAVKIALVQEAKVDQRLAVDHLQHAAIAVRDTDFAADAVARVDGEGGVDRALAARVFLGEFADGARRFSSGGLIEIGVVTIERGLGFYLDGAGPADA